jgi:hypothetical protein
VLVTGGLLESTISTPIIATQDIGTIKYNQSAALGNVHDHAVNTGIQVSGSTASLVESDGNLLEILADLDAANPRVSLSVTCTVGLNVTELCFEVQSSVTVAGVTQNIELFNMNTGDYERVDRRAATQYQRTIHYSVPGNPYTYIDANDKVYGRITFDDSGVSEESWKAYVNLANCRVLR